MLNSQQAKDFILSRWSISSGARIKEMLLRYKPYFMTARQLEKEKKANENIKLAEEIFQPF
jgi:hypothetical protein